MTVCSQRRTIILTGSLSLAGSSENAKMTRREPPSPWKHRRTDISIHPSIHRFIDRSIHWHWPHFWIAFGQPSIVPFFLSFFLAFLFPAFLCAENQQQEQAGNLGGTYRVLLLLFVAPTNHWCLTAVIHFIIFHTTFEFATTTITIQ